MTHSEDISSKDRIFEAAVELFAKKGFANTGVRELADHAGVNLAMINYFYGSKKGLLKVILDEFFSGYLEILEKELSAAGTVDEKLERFIKKAIAFIGEHSNSMIVTLTELPHDDPDITEHKAIWARRAMLVIKSEICDPLGQECAREISPAVIGPLLICMMTSRFIFAPVMEQVKPPGYGEVFFQQYPDMVKQIFLYGINGLKDMDMKVDK